MLLLKSTKIQVVGIDENPLFPIVSAEIKGFSLSLQETVSMLGNIAPVVAIDGWANMGLWLDHQIPVDVEAPYGWDNFLKANR